MTKFIPTTAQYYCYYYYCAIVGVNFVDWFTAQNMDNVK
jgi:hypothetical protein